MIYLRPTTRTIFLFRVACAKIGGLRMIPTAGVAGILQSNLTAWAVNRWASSGGFDRPGYIRLPQKGKSMKRTRRNVNECEICGAKNTHIWRCYEHHRCDDCGTKENLCSYSEGLLCDRCHDKRVEKRIAEFEGDTDYTQEVVCPWCGYEHSDSWEMTMGKRECNDCGREFEAKQDCTVTYSTSRI